MSASEQHSAPPKAPSDYTTTIYINNQSKNDLTFEEKQLPDGFWDDKATPPGKIPSKQQGGPIIAKATDLSNGTVGEIRYAVGTNSVTFSFGCSPMTKNSATNTDISGLHIKADFNPAGPLKVTYTITNA